MKLDAIDARILNEIQRDGRQNQRELADRVGLSQNACWRRLKLLSEAGITKGTYVKLDAEKLGKSLVVFTMVRTRSHGIEWLNDFRTRILSIPDIVGFYRISGDYDYMIKMATADMKTFDLIYQKIIRDFTLDTVTSYFAMEVIADDRPIFVEPKFLRT